MSIHHPTSIIRHFTILVFVLCSIGAFSQKKKYLNHELMVENDNDAYTLNLTRDQYYSNGVALRYRFLTDSSKWGSSIEKVIRAYHINHRIFSPRHLFWRDSSQMDRPYAGQMSLSVSNEYYFKKKSYLAVELELGWMGPSLRIGNLQYEWHKTFGMQLPLGWRFQINDTPIINLWGTYAKTVFSRESFDITPESNFTVGTAFGHVRQELMFRIGNILPIHQSTQFNGVVGRENNGPGQKEIYFFISPGMEYVFFNSTIEGNIIGEESIFIKETLPWIYQTRAGFMMSWTKFDLAFLYYRRTKETSESVFHKYVGIRMNQRF